MIEISRDWRGDPFPVTSISNCGLINLDGTSAADHSEVLDAVGECLARVAAIDDIRIATGVAVSASATSTYMPAGMVEWFKIIPGERVSVFGGQANITVVS